MPLQAERLLRHRLPKRTRLVSVNVWSVCSTFLSRKRSADMNFGGQLEKLLIVAYDKPDYSGPPLGRFESLLNPNEITISYELEYNGTQAPGSTNSRMSFSKAKPGDLSLSFFID